MVFFFYFIQLAGVLQNVLFRCGSLVMHKVLCQLYFFASQSSLSIHMIRWNRRLTVNALLYVVTTAM